MISNTRLINTCSTIIKNKFNYAFPTPFDFPYRCRTADTRQPHHKWHHSGVVLPICIFVTL